MSHPMAAVMDHEPDLRTLEMLCDRLGGLGLPVGPETARDLVRSILELEAPRVDARMREALEISLDTIRIAAQSALGVLATTAVVDGRDEAAAPLQPVLDPAPARKAPPAGAGADAGGPRRPIAKRKPEDPAPDDLAAGPVREPQRGRNDLDDAERRPVFRRPRGR